jgi:hypothetical protein
LFINTVLQGSFMETIAPLWLWLVFVGFVLAALFVDFVVLKKQGAHAVGIKEAVNWSLIWVGLSFLFNGLLWWAVKDSTGSSELANQKSLEFLTGYLIEKSLAVDNIFVFLLIFSYFAVPRPTEAGADDYRRHHRARGDDPGGWLAAGAVHWLLYVRRLPGAPGGRCGWPPARSPTWATTPRSGCCAS